MLHVAPLAFALSTTPAPATALATKASHAAPVPRVSTAVAPRVLETSLLGGLGVSGGETHGGLGLSMLALHRISVLELGIELDASVLFSGMLGVGAVGGVHIGDDFSARLLAAGGVHHYSGVGKGLLSDNPGVTGATPYVGGRLIIGRRFAVSNPARRPFLGVLGAVDHDFYQRDLSVSYSQSNWFSGGVSERTSTHHLGQTTYTGLVIGGIELDLAPH